MADQPVFVEAGDGGPAVSDIQRRLAELGHAIEISGTFDDATVAAVQSFQANRNLPPDGVVGPLTWGALIEASWRLGDRVLYERHPPWLRGDDVAELQERLANLGFAVGKIDGIFGPLARQSVTEFQRNSGLVPDGVAGSETVRMLERVSTAPAAKPSPTVRERIAFRTGGRGLAGKRIFIDPRNGPGTGNEPAVRTATGTILEGDYTFALALALSKTLAQRGADTMLARTFDTCPPVSDRAALANWYDADVVLGLGLSDDEPPQHAPGMVIASYFGTHRFVSSAGKALARGLAAATADSLGFAAPRPQAASRPLLRETRAVAVQLELVPGADCAIADDQQVDRLALAIVEALEAFVDADAEPDATVATDG